MKFSTTLLVSASVLGVSASIHHRQDTPACAATCLAALSDPSSGCGANDLNCICTNCNVVSSVASCVATQCSPTDAASVFAMAQQVCVAASVTDLSCFAQVGTGASAAGSASAQVVSSDTNAAVVSQSSQQSEILASPIASIQSSASSVLASVSSAINSLSSGLSSMTTTSSGSTTRNTTSSSSRSSSSTSTKSNSTSTDSSAAYTDRSAGSALAVVIISGMLAVFINFSV